MDENFPHPGGHFVGLWCSEMNVEHKDRHTDAEIRAKLYEYTLFFYYVFIRRPAILPQSGAAWSLKHKVTQHYLCPRGLNFWFMKN